MFQQSSAANGYMLFRNSSDIRDAGLSHERAGVPEQKPRILGSAVGQDFLGCICCMEIFVLRLIDLRGGGSEERIV